MTLNGVDIWNRDIMDPFSGGSFSFYDYVVRSESGIKLFQCTVCGKESNDKSNLRKHVENIHFPGSFEYSCKHCSETCTTRNLLNIHISKMHRGLN